ncbi:sulfatase [Chthoniobacter flavus Ellin428]|uniref:Sulfatase n=1 Tax=Chthoniobacter flavus Ellin428 TaxID=497964 RepID=B4CVD2_9BACT|nr:sulfatase-like hydrolase/transferase [Chthoniobacter flavus]EDY21374.1 sulfatase [Chthoniobacter flavus Ellin428]TCO95337.1 arylsulfatase A-like enzyme [Chthoniobacter flavus]
MFPRALALSLCFAVSLFAKDGDGGASAPKSRDKPNIVFILCDDLGVNDLSCYGRKDQQTPNLDRLAGEGMRFTCAYCASPICSASRAAIMTGKAPGRVHITNFLPGRADAPSQKFIQPEIEGQLPLEENTIAKALHGAGYVSACIGKWHLGGKGFLPTNQGFDYAFAGHANTKPSATEGGKGEYELTAEAERWLEKNKDHPFFLYLAHNSPHVPLAAKPELIEKHKDAWNPIYAAMIESLDDCVGRIMKKVDELGLTEKTIFIFTSDNGGLHVYELPNTPSTYNAPFRAGKGYLEEGGLREPLIVRWPGKIKAGATNETPVVLYDFMPTLMTAAGLDVAHTVGPLDGVNILPLLTGGTIPPRTLYWHFPNYTNQGSKPAGAIRDGEWKLIQDDETGNLELYNIAADPGEKNDLAKSQSARVSELQGKLAAWRKSIGAQMGTANPNFDSAFHKRLYEDVDTTRLEPGPSAAALREKLTPWREGMDDAVKGHKPIVTPATGDIRLFAKDATVHGTTARYEPLPYKNTIGFWTKPEDWVSWDFEVPKAGKYEVEVQQGCGSSGGSEVAVEVAGQTLKFTVDATGNFQSFIQRVIGVVDLGEGKQTIAVKPQNKVGAAVMDLRRVVLRPAVTAPQ